VEQISRDLSRSIACYREMLDVYAQIRAAIGTGAPAAVLDKWMGRVQVMDGAVRDSDARFQAAAAEAGVSLEDLPEFAAWQALVARAQEANRAMQRHLQAALAVTSDELSRMESGRQALSGYKSGREAPTGRRINIRSA